jgi:pimeloyl-ACP methyl ester carboxylesterase
MSIRHPAFGELVGRMDDANYSMSDEHYRLLFACADIPRDATEDTLDVDTVEAVERLTCLNIPATPAMPHAPAGRGLLRWVGQGMGRRGALCLADLRPALVKRAHLRSRARPWPSGIEARAPPATLSAQGPAEGTHRPGRAESPAETGLPWGPAECGGSTSGERKRLVLAGFRRPRWRC